MFVVAKLKVTCSKVEGVERDNKEKSTTSAALACQRLV